MEFFEFYSFFDFAERGVSVISGATADKPDPTAPVYIENPLERELNVSKNVLEGHLQIFQTQCRWALDTLGRSSAVLRSRKDRDMWGLLSILKTDDQLRLTEEAPQTRTADAVDIPLTSTENDAAADADHVSAHLHSLPLGVVNIHEILREDADAVGDSVADNVSNRTV